jgi:hypothetical protein
MTVIKRLLQLASAVAVALVILTHAKPASAGCLDNLMICYQVAAGGDMDWLAMWWAGMICEFDWADCVRQELVGR